MSRPLELENGTKLHWHQVRGVFEEMWEDPETVSVYVGEHGDYPIRSITEALIGRIEELDAISRELVGLCDILSDEPKNIPADSILRREVWLLKERLGMTPDPHA